MATHICGAGGRRVTAQQNCVHCLRAENEKLQKKIERLRKKADFMLGFL